EGSGETTAQSAFFKFISAPHGHPDRAITTLYLGGIRREALIEPAARDDVRRFLTAAHRRGLLVEFLCGDSRWAQKENHEEALGFLRAVLSFNRAAPAPARFDGFQYDVEPYLLKEWPAPALRRDFLRLFERARAEVDAGAPRGLPRLVLGAAVPFWFDQEKLEWLDRAVLDRVDYLALMDYVNNAPALIERAAGEIAYAGKIKKRIVIGMETQRLKDEPTATFFAEGNSAMERAVSAAARQYGKTPGFGGFAIHHLTSYRTFAP
ncbi:MAG: hypothetical protein V4671_26610, partial [Armatimonadota bacterium]